MPYNMSLNKKQKLDTDAIIYKGIEKFHYKYCALSSRSTLRCRSACNFNVMFNIECYKSTHYLNIRCNKCGNKWYVCWNCDFQKKPYDTIYVLKKHIEKHHRTETKSERIEVDNKLVVEKPRSLDFNFCRAENNKYFDNDQSSDGPTYLVGLSQFHLQCF